MSFLNDSIWQYIKDKYTKKSAHKISNLSNLWQIDDNAVIAHSVHSVFRGFFPMKKAL